jgi:hypothetical protein
MSDITNIHLIDAPVAPARQAEIVKDRRRPGRIHDVSRALVPLLRDPTAGLVAGDLTPVDSFQIVAVWAQSAYPTDIWFRMSVAERSTAIYREMRKLDVASAALSSVGKAS